MPSDDSASCLVARAMPCTIRPTPPSDVSCVKAEKDNSADVLADSLKKLSMHSEHKSITINKKSDLSPADFVQLQNIRSSALARKTNTTSKFSRDSDSLFDDLLLKENTVKSKPDLKKLIKKESVENKDVTVLKVKSDKSFKVSEEALEEKKNTMEDKVDELLSRGPVRTSRPNINFHPYVGANGYPSSSSSYEQNSPTHCVPSQYDPTQTQWTVCREQLSNSSTPDSFNSDLGYSSSTSPPQPHYGGSFTKADLKGFLTSGSGVNNELPDALSDFILKYSRRYTNTTNPFQTQTKSGRSSEAHSPVELIANSSNRPSSVESNVCDSPLSAGSAPHASPAGPHGGITGPSTPQSGYRISNSMGQLRAQLPSTRYSAYVSRRSGQTEQQHRPAKESLRNKIQEMNNDALDEAWAWTCKCQQYYPGALCYQDSDKDTLVHIVTQHLDLPKIYALVEQMLKEEYASHERPFDMKNRDGITPLFLAVEKRNTLIVDYLLEAGADPNSQNARYERDAPLHYAAARGMVDQVKTICSYGATNLNAQNGMGLTPLLCAVKNHGVFDEDSKTIVNNSEIIHILLKYGADPMIPDATNGRTAVHYAVDRLAPEILDVFKNNLEESVLTLLVNLTDNNRETSLDSVQLLTNVDEVVKQKLGLSLIMCGASNDVSSPDEY